MHTFIQIKLYSYKAIINILLPCLDIDMHCRYFRGLTIIISIVSKGFKYYFSKQMLEINISKLSKIGFFFFFFKRLKKLRSQSKFWDRCPLIHKAGKIRKVLVVMPSSLVIYTCHCQTSEMLSTLQTVQASSLFLTNPVL